MRLAGHELLARLAETPTSEIFLGRHPTGLRAIHRLRSRGEPIHHLQLEAAGIATLLLHPNICQVHAIDEAAGCVVTEYLEGVTLRALLREAWRQQLALAPGFVVGVMIQVCEALHHAHELVGRDGTPLHIVHREVTPASVVVDDRGAAKVVDFGFRKIAVRGDVPDVTRYSYLAPEQVRAHPLTSRSDVFSLGVIAYEMLALRRLFFREEMFLTLRAVLEQPIVDLRRYRPELPPAVGDAIGRALERDPARRLTARTFARDLVAAVSPWSPSEIGAVVRQLFATELDRRRVAIARGALDETVLKPEDVDPGYPAVDVA